MSMCKKLWEQISKMDMGIWRFDQNPRTPICKKLEAQVEPSKDKEGLFETLNAQIKTIT
jgi:hypothetical protein